MKKWTTTSEVTACAPGEVFEFVAEGYTTWRYRLEPSGPGTRVTESYEYRRRAAAQTFVYETCCAAGGDDQGHAANARADQAAVETQ